MARPKGPEQRVPVKMRVNIGLMDRLQQLATENRYSVPKMLLERERAREHQGDRTRNYRNGIALNHAREQVDDAEGKHDASEDDGSCQAYVFPLERECRDGKRDAGKRDERKDCPRAANEEPCRDVKAHKRYRLRQLTLNGVDARVGKRREHQDHENRKLGDAMPDEIANPKRLEAARCDRLLVCHVSPLSSLCTYLWFPFYPTKSREDSSHGTVADN